MILNSRQLAATIWLILFVGWALTRREVRNSVPSVLKAMLAPKLLALWVVIIGANVAFVWLLWREGRWNLTMLYDTLGFISIGGIGSASKAASQDATYDARFFFRTVFANLGFMVVFAFLSDFFPLNFWLEFLLVIPFLTVLGMLLVFSEYQKGADQVHRLLTSVQSFVGILLICYVAWRVATSYTQLLNAQVFSSLVLPFVLSVLFLPLFILICAVFVYENAFLMVSLKSEPDDRVGSWKRRQLFLRFGLNLAALQAFRRSPVFQEYAWVKTKGEARAKLQSWSTTAPVAGDDG